MSIWPLPSWTRWRGTVANYKPSNGAFNETRPPALQQTRGTGGERRARRMKVYLVDIETTPNLGYTWGKWEQSVIEFRKEWELLSFAYKELDKGTVRCLARPDY